MIKKTIPLGNLIENSPIENPEFEKELKRRYPNLTDEEREKIREDFRYFYGAGAEDCLQFLVPKIIHELTGFDIMPVKLGEDDKPVDLDGNIFSQDVDITKLN